MKKIKMMCFLLALLGLLSACSAHSVDAEEQSAPTWQSRYDLGVRYLSDGRYEEAILAFTAAIEIDPKNAQAYEQRGNAYWELAQSAQGSEQTDAYRSAAEDYESAMQWGSETDELYRRAADAYYGAQDYEKAESYYEKLLEKDEDVLARLIECSRALGTGKKLAKRLQARYLETGEERYLQALCELWPQEALRAYAALLGTDGTMGFALVDLDEDGTPELICGEIDTQGQSEQIALTDYTLYTWKNDQVTELYHGFAIAICPNENLESPTIVGAQAANELLDINGVKASVVLTDYQHKTYVSARSIDEVNVQLLAERMGGGGHLNMAGAQLDCGVEEALEIVKHTIDKLHEEGEF